MERRGKKNAIRVLFAKPDSATVNATVMGTELRCGRG
jgi:hypothetical protein